MILFADSGSTKTSWLFYNDSTKKKSDFETLGINPVIQNHHEINEIINQNADLLKLKDDVKVIRFFGAGCSSTERNDIVRDVLQINFPNAQVYVDHDMKAAGIAVTSGAPGIACILGTGSNSILFDGNNWVESKIGMGYVLSDEGSGAFMGKYLLRDFLYEILPAEIQKHLKEEMKLTKSEILEKVYKRPSPNRYLAGFAPVLTIFRDTPYVQHFLAFSFEEFFKYGVATYDNYQRYRVGFVGSIAYNFKDELKIVADKFGCELGKFVKRPIDDIAEYFIAK
ncbi:MAG: N-acetylglucosamine kinase [Bacteroidota bacterium]|nr:N-acetylglucosamine kinase [Bacteroidota bacterium]